MKQFTHRRSGLVPASVAAVLIVLTCAFLMNAQEASAQATTSILTIHAFICDNGYLGTNYAGDCTNPSHGSAFGVSGSAPNTVDATGSLTLPIPIGLPGTLMITDHTDGAAWGPVVSCVAGGAVVDASFQQSPAARAPFEVVVPTDSEVVCDLYYSNDVGFPNHQTDGASGNSGAGNAAAVQLPNTGVGMTAAPRGVFGLIPAIALLVASVGVTAVGFFTRRFRV